MHNPNFLNYYLQMSLNLQSSPKQPVGIAKTQQYGSQLTRQRNWHRLDTNDH